MFCFKTIFLFAVREFPKLFSRETWPWLVDAAALASARQLPAVVPERVLFARSPAEAKVGGKVDETDDAPAFDSYCKTRVSLQSPVHTTKTQPSVESVVFIIIIIIIIIISVPQVLIHILEQLRQPAFMVEIGVDRGVLRSALCPSASCFLPYSPCIQVRRPSCCWKLCPT